MAETKQPGRYHHGDLRQALLDAALDLIAQDGAEAISLRQLAKRVGVTTGAPYHHFKDKGAVLAAVATEGFRKLGTELEDSARAYRDVVERFTALGVVYMRFAVEHPAHYQVMFRRDLHHDGDEDEEVEHPDLAEAGGAAFDRLIHGIGEVRPDLDDDQKRAAAVLAWSTVHGFAMLWTAGAISKKTMIEDVDPLIHMVSRNCTQLILKARVSE